LAQKQDAFEALGIQLVGVSYDSVRVLKDFSQAQKGERKARYSAEKLKNFSQAQKGERNVRFPLLSDPNSEMIKAFGVLNKQTYKKFENQKEHRFYGVPQPHVFLVDPKGRIVAKFAEYGFRNRTDIDRILTLIKKRQNKPDQLDKK